MAVKSPQQYKYVLTKQFQDVLDGKVITTSLNMDKFKDFETFMEALVKEGTAKPEKADEYCSSYYYDAYLDYKQYQKDKIEARKHPTKTVQPTTEE